MLDLSQYAGSRAKRGLSVIEFWRQGSEEQLRKVSLIFDLLRPGEAAKGIH